MKAQYQPKQDNQECEDIVRGAHQGVLALCRDNEPYAIPMNHAYEEGRLYFHCAPTGLKLDFIRENPSVVYVVSRYWGPAENFKAAEKCHGQWESVVIHGSARVVEDKEGLRDAFIRFMRGHGDDDFEPSEDTFDRTRAIVVEVTRMSARREDERKKTEYFTWER